MEPQQIELLIGIVVESAIHTLIFFSVVALALGLLLLVSPQKVVWIKSVSDRWMTPRKSLKPLELPRESDSILYRHHRWVGSITIILPIITGYLLLYGVIDELPRAAVSGREHYLFWQWLFDSTIIFLWLSNIAAFIIGSIIFFRPSLLRRFEALSNRWLSTRQGLRRLDQSYSQLDELMLKRSKWTGIFL
ncbi:MAG: hypothetical protein OQK78_01165, partial [Gammaproteobacteria bacterium]|nr:hypothetical protein [Gammaproteobacteria bacterium]